jgi:hypothetical protein
MKHILKVMIGALLFVGAVSGVMASIVVPGDFPGNFDMILKVGAFAVDSGPAGSPVGQWGLDVQNKDIPFSGSAFNGIGLGAGTSMLSLNLSHQNIASAPDVYGYPATFFISGTGSGSLVDNVSSTAGTWTLTVPLFADWNGYTHDLGEVTLSTANTVSFWEDNGSGGKVLGTATGQSMNYTSGNGLFVGQTFVQGGPLVGLRVSIGFLGNDPPSLVPVPAAVWLFGSGLLGLFGVARRRKAA